MKVVAFNGSPRKQGNTYRALQAVTTELQKEGIETEIINVGRYAVRGCSACNWCARNGGLKCVFDDDPVNVWIEAMKEADGILLGSPVYFAGVNGTLKSFLDRAGYVLSMQPGALRFKAGAAVVAVRRTGGSAALDELYRFINYFEMVSPASNYWNVIHGLMPGELAKDEEGMQILSTLGRNMAWLMKVLERGRGEVPMPEPERKVMTNFVR